MTLMKRYSRTIGVLGVVLSLSSSAQTRAEVFEFAALLTGECAGSGAPEKAWGNFNLDTSTGIVTFRVDFNPNIQPRFAHVHGPIFDACSEAGNGPIIYDLPFLTNPSFGSVMLSPAEVLNMMAGRHYANFHSDAFPDAHTSGQLVPITKNRFLSVIPSATAATSIAATQAIRVVLSSLHHPNPPYSGGAVTDFSAFEGEVRWLGPPQSVTDRPASKGTFWGSQLQCSPHFMDWKGLAGIVQIYGAEVIPSSKYEIQFADDTCADLADPLCYNEAMKVRTSRWGDTTTPYADYVSSQPNFSDITALVETFKATPSSIGIPRALLQANVAIPLSAQINFANISLAVGAFQGKPYPYAGPTHCGP